MSPGGSWMTAKMMMEMSTSVGTIPRVRRTIYGRVNRRYARRTACTTAFAFAQTGGPSACCPANPDGAVSSTSKSPPTPRRLANDF